MCILFGYMAMARPVAGTIPQAADRIDCHTATVIENDAVACEDECTYSGNQPRKKQVKIRPKFLSVSFFKVRNFYTEDLINSAFAPVVTRLYGGSAAHLLPFYYVFLFRLTPF